MKISSSDSGLAQNDFSGQSALLQPEQTDIDFFSAQLKEEPQVEKVSAPGNVTNMFKGLADSMHNNDQQRKETLKELQTASRSSNMAEFNQASAALSDYYIENLMNAKIVSKGVQSIDKLTNLQ
ncbi:MULTISPECIES: EscI/YscI/HrpB family type III secretion system inner rod protein [Erwinia]|uniref:EscI/YscI/HrpB family type III secretion system inner rod protein n=1 Tax=Erwinia TaxID=551 RepID=UPI00055820CA|nr:MULTISPECIES: EscI/YscI/HrpB family type III secretion system inner rod protein [Erwinia]